MCDLSNVKQSQIPKPNYKLFILRASCFKPNICSMENLVSELSWWSSVYIHPRRTESGLRASTRTNGLLLDRSCTNSREQMVRTSHLNE